MALLLSICLCTYERLQSRFATLGQRHAAARQCFRSSTSDSVSGVFLWTHHLESADKLSQTLRQLICRDGGRGSHDLQRCALLTLAPGMAALRRLNQRRAHHCAVATSPPSARRGLHDGAASACKLCLLRGCRGPERHVHYCWTPLRGYRHAVHEAMTGVTACGYPSMDAIVTHIDPTSGRRGRCLKRAARQTNAAMGEVEHALTISELRQHPPDVLDRQHVLAAAQHPSVPALRRHALLLRQLAVRSAEPVSVYDQPYTLDAGLSRSWTQRIQSASGGSWMSLASSVSAAARATCAGSSGSSRH